MTEILLKVALNIITITLAPNHVTLYGNFKVFIIRSSYHIYHRIVYCDLKIENLEFVYHIIDLSYSTRYGCRLFFIFGFMLDLFLSSLNIYDTRNI